MKKVWLAVVFFGFLLTLSGCSPLRTIEKRFEDAGYTFEKVDESEHMEWGMEEADIRAIYNVLDSNEQWVATIFEFKNTKTLEDALLEDGNIPEGFDEHVHQNLFILTFSQTVLDIFKDK